MTGLRAPLVRAQSGSYKRRRRLGSAATRLFSSISLFFCVSTHGAQDSSLELGLAPQSIAEGETIHSTQRTNQPKTYVFSAFTDRKYILKIEQDGLDFAVDVESPDGTRRPYNSPSKRIGIEFILLSTNSPGQYLITIDSTELTHAEGSYTIRIESLDLNDAAVERRTEAMRLMTIGAENYARAIDMRLNDNRVGDRIRTTMTVARNAYNEARLAWEALAETELQAQSAYSAAMIEYWDLYNWAESARLSELAAQLYRSANNYDSRHSARFLHAYSLVEMAGELENDSAAEAYLEALAIFGELENLYTQSQREYELADLLNFTGYTHHLRGDILQAEVAWERSAPIFADIGEWRQELNVRQNLAVIELDRGYAGKAAESLEYVVGQIPQGKDPEFQAAVLTNLGIAHRHFGRIDASLKAYDRALTIYRELGDEAHVATSLRGLGATYYVAGQYELATGYLLQALDISVSAKDRRHQAVILTYLGNIAYMQHDYKLALHYHEQSVEATQSEHERASRQVLVARDLISLGRYSGAIAEVAQIAASKAVSPVIVADAYLQLGRASINANDVAADYLKKSLEIYESLGLQEGAASALHSLSVASRETQDFELAIAYGDASLVRLESLRTNVSAPELRAFFSSRRRNYYESQIDLLMAEAARSPTATDDRTIAALGISERARARTLVDLLNGAIAPSRSGSSADQRQRLYQELAAMSYQRDELINGGISSLAVGRQLNALLEEMTEIENQLTLLSTNSSSDLSDRTKVLDGEEIQALVDPDTVLLQYSLGSQQSYVWVVTRDTIEGVTIAGRQDIEAAARSAFKLLEDFSVDQVSRRRLNDSLLEVSRLVLQPVANSLSRSKVIIVPDGVLHYIPFSALFLESSDGESPLVKTHELVSLPSMSVLAAQRSRRVAEPEDLTIAIFADPVLEYSDERMASYQLPGRSRSNNASELSPLSSEGIELQRLVATRDEANFIAQLVPDGNVFLAQGFEANRTNVLSTPLENYKYVHFATHGLINSRYPALSSLVFSQFDESGETVNGVLRLHDIYDMKLNADLVVLSACETGLGREVRGEGLMGMSQGFMYAGARSLMVSLWQVSDRATAEMMSRFYEGVIQEKLTPPAALRKAQNAMASDRRWRDPYFWAPFVLVGDWE